MRMRITGSNVSISPALKTYTERRLMSAIENTSPPFKDAEVRLSDINGTRGGVDIECGMRVVLRHAGVVFVRASGGDAYSTVDKAATRLRVAMTRRIARYRSMQRRVESRFDAGLSPFRR
jgi:putative sigma-54 modulation protein